MAAATLALHNHHHYFVLSHHHRHFIYSSPTNSFATETSKSWNLNRKPLHLPFWTGLELESNTHGSLIHCSSSSTEATTPTAESCVNLGLSLFAKGRVLSILQFSWFLELIVMKLNPKKRIIHLKMNVFDADPYENIAYLYYNS